MVADMVIPYVEYENRFPLLVDIAEGIEGIHHRVVTLRESAQGDDRTLLTRYEQYVELLDAVFRAYLADSSSPA